LNLNVALFYASFSLKDTDLTAFLEK